MKHYVYCVCVCNCVSAVALGLWLLSVRLATSCSVPCVQQRHQACWPAGPSSSRCWSCLAWPWAPWQQTPLQPQQQQLQVSHICNSKLAASRAFCISCSCHVHVPRLYYGTFFFGTTGIISASPVHSESAEPVTAEAPMVARAWYKNSRLAPGVLWRNC